MTDFYRMIEDVTQAVCQMKDARRTHIIVSEDSYQEFHTPMTKEEEGLWEALRYFMKIKQEQEYERQKALQLRSHQRHVDTRG